MANFHNHHNNRNHHNRGKRNQNIENNNEVREEKESRENKRNHDQQEARAIYRERRERENREHKEHRDNQIINTFMLGEKELDDKNAQFHYDKGWYSIIDIIGEDKNVVYKSKNAQEAYQKWNVYIGRKKERPQKIEKAD